MLVRLPRAPINGRGSGGHPSRKADRGSVTSDRTWRSLPQSGSDLINVQRGTCREDEAVRRAVDQPCSYKPGDRFESVLSADVLVRTVADKLIDRPRPLVVGVEEPVHDAPIVHVLGFYGWVRLLLHRKVPPFGATPPAVSAVRGHFDREAATVSASRPSVNEFRYTFRQTLLEMGTRASSKVRAKTRPTPAQPEAKFDADTDSLPPPIAAGLVFIASGAVLVLEILAGGSTADQARLIRRAYR
jgi:hypothetical protein